MPTGSGDQLRSVPVSGADTIEISFTADVTLTGGELGIFGAGAGAYQGLVFEGYDALTFTGTWRVAGGPLPQDQYVITLADGVVDGNSDAADNEWSNPRNLDDTSDDLRDLSVDGAGDGNPGGSFQFHVNVLPGDFNLDNEVTSADEAIVLANSGLVSSGATFADGDFDGDGDVDNDDENAIAALLLGGPVDFTVFADVMAPRVTAVLLEGSNSFHAPYVVPTGSGEQLRSAPVGGVDTIRLTFSEGVTISGNELTAYGVKTGTAYSLNYVGYAWGLATWQLASGVFPAEQLLLRLDDSIVDAAGNALDGEFTNPWTLADAAGSSTTLPSGDGKAGGDFRFRATILAGDFDRDNDVDSGDQAVWTSNFGASGASQEQGDFNGDGYVDGTDYVALQTQIATVLTAWKSIEPGMILVSSVADEGDDSDYAIGDVTLREAVIRAATQGGADTLVFRDSLVGQTINLSLGSITIDSALNISGPGALTVAAGSGSRAFVVSDGSGSLIDVTISGMALVGGVLPANNDGGSIYSSESLTLDGLTVTGGSARTGGGLYQTGGSIVIVNTTFTGNTAVWGGGATIDGAAETRIIGSTFYDNDAVTVSGVGGSGSGAALYLKNISSSNTAEITNSTISGNHAGHDGGGIVFEGAYGFLLNITLVDNTAAGSGSVGGIRRYGGSVTLHNSIVAENVGVTHADVSDSFNIASSYNLVGLAGNSGLTNGVNGNKVGTTTALDPLLAALGDNGGSTWTHKPLLNSPVIDSASNIAADDLLFDQRGSWRLWDGDGDDDLEVDIGAVEYGVDAFFASL